MFLYGAGGHAKVVLEILDAVGIESDGVFDDFLSKGSIMQYPILGAFEDYSEPVDSVIISIGDNQARKLVANRLEVKFEMAVHPSCQIAPTSYLGKGTVVMPGAIINAEAQLGAHCIINTAAVVEHDCIIKDFVHIAPNTTLCGQVEVAEGVEIGAGAVVIPGVKIAKWAKIGAGSVVLKDVPAYATVVGNPGRVIGIKDPSDSKAY